MYSYFSAIFGVFGELPLIIILSPTEPDCLHLVMSYTVMDIMNLRHSSTNITPMERARINELGINREYRRCRTGKQVFQRIRKIQTRISDRGWFNSRNVDRLGSNTGSYNKPVQFLNKQNSKAVVCYINCSLINSRSVCNKIPILHENINNNNLDICFLTETEIPSILAPNGYSSHILSRDDKLGGCLAAIFNTKLKIRLEPWASKTARHYFEELDMQRNEYHY